MKNKLFLLLTILIPVVLSAQDSGIQWGTQVKAGSNDASYMTLGWADGKYYTVQIDNNNGTLMEINDKMDIAAQTELVTGEKKFDADDIIMKDGKIYVFVSNYENGEKTNYVRTTAFSMLGKQAGVKLKKVAAVKVDRNTEKTDFRYFYSQDSSMVLILHEHDMKASDPAKITLTVVKSEDFSTVWSKSEEFDYSDNDFAFISAGVENSGNVVMLALVKGDEGKRLEKYSTHVFSFTGKSDKYEENTLDLHGKFISSAHIKFISETKAMVAGFYNDLKDNGKNEGIEGAFISIVNPKDLGTLDIHTEALDAGPKAAITYTGAFAKLVQADELNAYNLEAMYINDAGEGYVIAEQRYMSESNDERSVTRTYHFNHLIIFRFDKDQSIQWISTIPKMQISSISSPKIGIGPLSFWYFSGAMVRYAYKYNSFVSTEKDGHIYILYNDNKDNGDARTVKEAKVMANKNKALATLVDVDKSGKWNKTPLFRGKDLDVIMETSSSFAIPGLGFTISAERGKNLQFGRLDLK